MDRYKLLVKSLWSTQTWICNCPAWRSGFILVCSLHCDSHLKLTRSGNGEFAKYENGFRDLLFLGLACASEAFSLPRHCSAQFVAAKMNFAATRRCYLSHVTRPDVT